MNPKYGVERILRMILMQGLLCAILMCDRSRSSSGTVTIITDSEACECVRKQGETILHQIDSLKIADSSLDKYFTFRQIDWAKDRETADAILDRCESPLIPVVRIEDPQGQALYNFSFEFDPALFVRILEDLKDMASTE
jgi:hypothetical protein